MIQTRITFVYNIVNKTSVPTSQRTFHLNVNTNNFPTIFKRVGRTQLLKTVGGDKWNGNRNRLEAPDWAFQEPWFNS